MIDEEKLETVKVEVPVWKNNVHKGTRIVEVAKSIADKELAKPDEKRGGNWQGARLWKDTTEEDKAKQQKIDADLKELEILRKEKAERDLLRVDEDKVKKEEKKEEGKNDKKGEVKNA